MRNVHTSKCIHENTLCIKKSFNFLAYEGMYNINGSQDRFNVIYEAFDCLLTKIGNHVAAFLDTN